MIRLMSSRTASDAPHHAATKRALERLRKMSPEERTETLVDAGILTPEHELADAYVDSAIKKRAVGTRR